MDATSATGEASQSNPVVNPALPLTRSQYEESILRRLSVLPLDQLAQLANFARFLEFEFRQLQTTNDRSQSASSSRHVGSADELLAEFAGREVLIYTPVAADGAAHVLAESLGRDEYGRK